MNKKQAASAMGWTFLLKGNTQLLHTAITQTQNQYQRAILDMFFALSYSHTDA
jgi:hypothetical protein